MVFHSGVWCWLVIVFHSGIWCWLVIGFDGLRFVPHLTPARASPHPPV